MTVRFRWALALLASLTPVWTRADEPASRPNIVIILADDLGPGDVRSFHPDGKIATPNLDRLASQGMRFTDAHSGSAVCTPTRYGILTGRYAWRTRLPRGVLGGYSPPLIPTDRLTLPSLLKRRGYRTGCVGKWHLGLGWSTKPGATVTLGDAIEPKGDPWEVDYAAGFNGGPTALGFDEFFGIAGSLDMPPFVFLEGDRCVSRPTTEKTYIRKGPAAEDFEAEGVLPALADRAVRFLEQRAAEPETPFFLYLPLNSPHTPIVPVDEFRGQSGLNGYADFVMQTDAAIGRVLESLDRLGLAESTLVFATSDNGCSPAAGLKDLAERGHDPSAGRRGAKADIYEGGHRIPLIARWPGVVPPGSTYGHPVCLNDLMATCVRIVGVEMPPDAGEDSVPLVDALSGQVAPPARESIVHHSIDGSFAIRRGRWKLALCPGSGGWSEPRPGSEAERGLPPVQLFDLESDPAERSNVQAEHPEIVAELTALLERIVDDGRSTPGPRQPNDREVALGAGGRPRREGP